MILEAAILEAQKAGLDKFLNGEYVRNQVLENRDSQLKDNSMQYISIELSLDVSEEDTKKIEEIFQSAREKVNSSVQTEVVRKLGAGSKLPNFGHIKKVFEEGTSEVSAKQGQVLLIDVWATWCGPCQKPMQHNQQMLEKNNWGEKVRIVGVSVDESIEQIKQRVTSRKWQKIQHLSLGGWNGQHSLIKSFGVDGIPFVCLVNKFGIIQYTGHPSSIDLENKINELLKEQGNKAQNNQQSAPSSDSISQAQYNKLFETIGNKTFFQQNFMKTFISSRVLSTIKIRGGKISHSAKVEVYTYEDDKQLIDQYEKLIPSKNIKFETKFVEVEHVPEVSKNCHQCKKNIQYPLYWCKWSEQPGDFRCLQCVQKKQSETVYSYKSNSILLFGQYKKIAKKGLGKNIQPSADQKVEELYPNQFGCNGCGDCPQNVGQARYICLGCRSEPNYRGDYVDLCQKCIKKYIVEDQSVIQRLKPDGHVANHPFLRVLYNVKGYYEY